MMACIRKEILLDASAENVWSAVRDVGALHERLVPGFVVDTRLEGAARVVTFGNGMVVRELIVDLDGEARRLAWSPRGGRLTHHHASGQGFAEGAGRPRARWVPDPLPNELPGGVRAMIDQGAAIMNASMEERT